MGAEYLSYAKFIATRAPTFFGYIISVLASVNNETASFAGVFMKPNLIFCLVLGRF